MTPTRTPELGRLLAAERVLLLSLVPLLAGAGCPPSKATYVLRSTGHDWLRMGPAEGEVVLDFFSGGKKVATIPLKDVLELGRFERLDAKRRPMSVDPDNAPTFVRISGLPTASGGRNGEWRLAWCAKRQSENPP